MTAAETDRRPTVSGPTQAPVHVSRPGVARVVIGGVLVLVGVLWGAERAGWIEISATAVLALATMAIGIAAVVRSTREEHPGLIAIGIVLAAVTALTAAAPFEGFQGGVGDRTVEVADVSNLARDYDLGAGELVLDLRALTEPGRPETITANVGIGNLIIRVPSGVALDVDVNNGAGEVVVPDRAVEGVLLHETYQSPGADEATDRLTIDANVLFGRIEVTSDE